MRVIDLVLAPFLLVCAACSLILPIYLAAVPTLLNVEVKKFELVAVASVADLAVLVQAVLNIEPK